MKNKIAIVYIFLSTLLFVSYLYSVFYKNVLHEKIYLNYIPKNAVRPQYSLETGLVGNADEVTYWSDWDHIPWYGIISYKIYRFTASNGPFLCLLGTILLIPIIAFYRKRMPWFYWVIVLVEYILCTFWFTGILIT